MSMTCMHAGLDEFRQRIETYGGELRGETLVRNDGFGILKQARALHGAYTAHEMHYMVLGFGILKQARHTPACTHACMHARMHA